MNNFFINNSIFSFYFYIKNKTHNNFQEKVIFIILLFTFFVFSQYREIKKNEDSHNLLNVNFSDLNIYEPLKNKSDIELYLKNKTAFYLQKRIKFLLTKNFIYNESKLITYQDKMNYLMIHESPSYKSLLADKIKVHEYSKKILGKDICVPIIKIYDNIGDINFDELPNQFVLKLNHGSNMNIICRNKTELNITDTLLKLEKYKHTDWGLMNAEFQYIYIKRKIFAESFMGSNLIDYKIYCFNGNPKFIRIRTILKNNTSVIKVDNHYDLNWELNNIVRNQKGFIRDPKYKIKKPKNLKLMLNYAKLLSQEFVFLRVDLYEINNKVYLGELTFSPVNNLFQWKNLEQDIYVGNFLNISKIKTYLFNK